MTAKFAVDEFTGGRWAATPTRLHRTRRRHRESNNVGCRRPRSEHSRGSLSAARAGSRSRTLQRDDSRIDGHRSAGVDRECRIFDWRETSSDRIKPFSNLDPTPLQPISAWPPNPDAVTLGVGDRVSSSGTELLRPRFARPIEHTGMTAHGKVAARIVSDGSPDRSDHPDRGVFFGLETSNQDANATDRFTSGTTATLWASRGRVGAPPRTVHANSPLDARGFLGAGRNRYGTSGRSLWSDLRGGRKERSKRSSG